MTFGERHISAQANYRRIATTCQIRARRSPNSAGSNFGYPIWSALSSVKGGVAPDIVEAILADSARQSLILQRLEQPLAVSWEQQHIKLQAVDPTPGLPAFP
jgi:hypothetical protein